MRMKNGGEVPISLMQALSQDSYALEIFLRLRPSCQVHYASHIAEAKSEKTARRRAESAINHIRKYGQKHHI